MTARLALVGFALLGSCGCESAVRPSTTDIVATFAYGASWGPPGADVVVEVAPNGVGRIGMRPYGSKALTESYGLVTAQGQNLDVRRRNGVWLVADAIDYSNYLRRGGSPRTPPSLSNGSFRAMGTERVGKWTGTHYVLSEKPHAYEGPSDIVVMTNTKFARLGRVLGANYLYSMRGLPFEPPKHIRQMADLFALGVPLRVGDMTIKELETRKSDASRFRPPSQLLSKDELYRVLDADRPKGPPIVTVPKP